MNDRQLFCLVFLLIILQAVSIRLGFDEYKQFEKMWGGYFLIVYSILATTFLNFSKYLSVNQHVLEQFSYRMYKQIETAIVMNNLQESILIKSDKKIDIMNANFIETFNHLLSQNMDRFKQDSMLQLKHNSLITRIKNWFYELNEQ